MNTTVQQSFLSSLINFHNHCFYFFRISIGYKRKNTFLKRPPIIPFWSASIPASRQPHDYFSLLNLCAVVILCTYSSHVFTNFLYFYTLEPVCCKKQQKSSWPVTGLRNRGHLKDQNDSKLIVYESKWFPWSSRINFIPFRIFRGPLFHKPVTGQEPFFLTYF